MPDQPLKVFISYSHKDEAFKDDLKAHLSALVRQAKIQLWQDRAMEAGTKWDDQIKQQLEESDIILLLISSRFMASGYINDVELKRALERDKEGSVRVIPIILKPTDLEGTEISRLQALPKDAKAISKWPDEDDAYLNIVQGIRRVVDTLWQQPRAVERVAANPAPAGNSAVASAPASEFAKRLELSDLLSRLLKAQFDQILFVLNVPAAYRPASTLPQGERASELLTWATSDSGCGLDQLEQATQAVLKR